VLLEVSLGQFSSEILIMLNEWAGNGCTTEIEIDCVLLQPLKEPVSMQHIELQEIEPLMTTERSTVTCYRTALTVD
jgi:hypothetical protein